MSEHEEQGSHHKRNHSVHHQQQITYQRTAKSYHYDVQYFAGGTIQQPNIADHHDNGQWFQHPQCLYFEGLSNELKKHSCYNPKVKQQDSLNQLCQNSDQVEDMVDYYHYLCTDCFDKRYIQSYQQSLSLFVLQERDSTPQYVYIGIQILRHRLQHQHIGQKQRYLAVYLHIVLPHHLQHLLQHLQPLQRFQGRHVHPLEHLQQIIEILLVLKLNQGQSLVHRYPVYPLGAFQRVPLYDLLQKIQQIILLLLRQTDSHPHIYQSNLHVLFTLLPQFNTILLVLIVFLAQLPQKIRVKTILDELRNQITFGRIEHLHNLISQLLRRLFYSDQYVPRMTISMHQIVLHQHRKKCLSPYGCNNFVHVVNIALVKTYRPSLYELLNQNLVCGLRVHNREIYVFFIYRRVEFVQILLLLQKQQLLRQDPLQ